jgi:hypothetical protein
MRTFTPILVCLLLLGPVPSALADHTNPRERQATTQDPGGTELLTFGEGEWEFIRNFPANPGTDLEIFRKGGRLWASTGTLGQADEQHVGQRFIRLLNKRGQVKIRWTADHGSANCPTANPSGTTGLQHDVQVTPKNNPKLAIDTTDATGRCHDPAAGGLELIDISRLADKKFKPREVHLTRHTGTSHTVTRDAKRPWIIYNNASESVGAPWIDVLDIRSCLGKGSLSLKKKRAACRPEVFRIHLHPEWTQRIDANGERIEGTEASCHDITSKGYTLYCANLNSTVVLDVKGLTDSKGNIKGTPLKCKLADGTNTKAKITDCSDLGAVGSGQARGWSYYGHMNHAGRNGTHNTNTEYTSREQVAVSHEAEPTPDKRFMFVTDERGGGIVPGGASCTNETTDVYGNGGVHVYDISNPGEFEYAQTPDGEKAVFIGDATVPSSTFCTAHVMEQMRGEQRFSIAWYTQGTKIVDWFTDAADKWTFRETASAVPQNPTANTWASEVFKKKLNDDGTVSYWFIATDITRGIDIMKWTGPANPIGTPPPTATRQQKDDRSGALGVGLLLLPGALWARRRSHAS